MDDKPAASTTAVNEEPKREKKKKSKRDKIPEKYKGYEILLDAEEDPDFVPPKGTHQQETQ